MTEKQKVSAGYVELTFADKFDPDTGYAVRDEKQELKLTKHIRGFWAPTEERLISYIKGYCEHYGVLSAETVDKEAYQEQQEAIYWKQQSRIVETQAKENREYYESQPQISL